MNDRIDLAKTPDPRKLRVRLDGKPVGVIVRDALGWTLEDGNLGDLRKTARAAAEHLVATLRPEERGDA